MIYSEVLNPEGSYWTCQPTTPTELAWTLENEPRGYILYDPNVDTSMLASAKDDMNILNMFL